MTKLSDIQLVILTAACQRTNQLALPLPEHLRGGTAQKVISAFLAKRLLAEVVAGRGDLVWREKDDGQRLTLLATDAALAALKIAPGSRPPGDSTAATAPGESARPSAPQKPPAGRTEARKGKVREGTKQAHLVAMLRRAEGATITQIVEATGWRPHTGARSACRSAEEAARAHDCVREGRGSRARLQDRAPVTARHRRRPSEIPHEHAEGFRG